MAEYLKDECLKYNMRGVPYNEMSCIYPSLRPLYSNYELSETTGALDPIQVHEWMVGKSYIPIGAVILYGLGIVFGKAYFEKNKAYNWRTALGLWSLSLSLFSWFGFFRMFPNLLHNVTTKTLRDNMCNHPEVSYGSGVTGLWTMLFILSKFPELIDTVFIIVHKKPLIFLHWYHHITVLLFCWHSYVTRSPVGIFFATMNYAVHAIMYGYYTLMVFRIKPKWFKAHWITIAQISQMVVGVAITIISYYYIKNDTESGDNICWISKENTLAASVMYGSYLLLFVKFFVERYVSGKKTTKTTKNKKENKEVKTD